jgi:hypothetical protein
LLRGVMKGYRGAFEPPEGEENAMGKAMVIFGAAVIAAVALFPCGKVCNTAGGPNRASAVHREQVGESSADPVFCPVRSAGQLCDHGTAALLRLQGEKRARWNRAVRKYNQAVESAQRRLVTDIQSFLSPAEVKQVGVWFAPEKIALQPRTPKLEQRE